jgi:uncharacterized protein YhjY with autotransporter beta-barrel domain
MRTPRGLENPWASLRHLRAMSDNVERSPPADPRMASSNIAENGNHEWEHVLDGAHRLRVPRRLAL